MNKEICILVLLLGTVTAHAETRTQNFILPQMHSTTSSVTTGEISKVTTEKRWENNTKMKLSQQNNTKKTKLDEINGDGRDGVGGSKNVEIDFPETFSVVQDWHLLCKQLCGAGLGGPSCGNPQCTQIKNSQKKNIFVKAYRLLSSNKDKICIDLCKYQLGGDICKCHSSLEMMSRVIPSAVMWDRNLVCFTFCLHNDITLTGCSMCSKLTYSLENPINNDPTMTTTIFKTTPDWKEVCAALCKTGDGGALCNCDKPPFF